MCPSQHDVFPSHYSLVQQLIYSEKTIKRLKLLLKNKIAYIVSGVPTTDDIKLSDMLNVPILGSEPQK